jgi:DNA-binding NarL/FixJ family response regulator
MEHKQRICIAEDITILREGLRALLSSDPELEVVDEASDGIEALQSVQKHQPDLLLLDISMPRQNGLETIHAVKRRSPQTKVLVLTVHNAEEYVYAALKAGANGYLLKDSSRVELLLGIKSVLAGDVFVSPNALGLVIQSFFEGKKGPSSGRLGMLTNRERELLKLIAEGYKNKQIAEYLHISVKTVEKHRGNLISKLDLHNTAELTAFAIEKGLVTK